MRRQYSGDQPNEAQWSIANAGDTGEVLQTAMRLGAKTDLLDEAWWLPSIFIANGGAAAASLGRAASAPAPSSWTRRAGGSATSRTPTSRSARRCTRTRPSRAGWSSTTATSAGTSPATRSSGALPQEAIDSGAVKRADTSKTWPARSGARRRLDATVQRFNQFALKGLDPDFGRGQSAYNDCLGDPGYRPNAARSAGQGAVLRDRGVPRRRRYLRGRGHRRVRTGSRREGPS